MELYENSYHNEKHFSFGKNWQNFLKKLNTERIENAKKSLIEFLGGKDKIIGKSFIDIGCGSGLFSLAALKLGAANVTSIDIDDFSLACTHYLRKKENNPPSWRIIKGSVLDRNFISSLGRFDFVYSWGVLHHSGNMYQALENMIDLIGPAGKFYLALYNDNKRWFEGTSKFWLKLKKIYNHSGFLTKKIILYLYVSYFIFGLLITGKNPWAYIKKYKSNRGMNWLNDIIDWLGGYPYEFASVTKIKNFLSPFGLTCEKCLEARSIGCNEYLFLKL